MGNTMDVISKSRFSNTDMLRYKYIDFTDKSLCILTEGTMKFTDPSEFNDPFDCYPEVDHKKLGEYLNTRKDLLKKSGDELGLSPAKRIQKKKQLIKRPLNAADHSTFYSNKNTRLGICSLSRSPLNILMWSHYADKHTGFVVEFSIPTELETKVNQKLPEYPHLEYLFPLKVDYDINRPKINPFESDSVNFDKHFLTKSTDWKYEEEERCFDHIRGAGIHRYNRYRILKSVIAGVRMKDPQFNELKKSVSLINSTLGLDVTLHKAKIKQGEFSLYVPDRSDLYRKSPDLG